MAYGLYLYKQIVNQGNRVVRIEIYQKDYSGASIEINSLQSATLVMDNQGEDLTAPIIKSSLNLTLVNTNQFDYEVFFTPDATKFKVVYKLDGVTEWTGYLTPDSYTENLSYRDTISLVARDNIGMLEQMKFNYLPYWSVASPQSILANALNKVSFDMSIEWASLKTDSENTNIKDVNIITRQYNNDKSWYEFLSILLSSLALQMRYVGGNKYKIVDINNFYSLGSSSSFIFQEQSGNRELVPAWRSANLNVDYQKAENAYSDYLEEFQYVYANTYQFGSDPILDIDLYNVAPYDDSPYWSNGGLMLFRPYDFQTNWKWLYLTGTYGGTSINTYTNKITYKKGINQTNNRLKITFSIPNGVFDPRTRIDTNRIIVPIQLRCNVFLDTGTTKYILKNVWEVYNPLDPPFYITFNVAGSTGNFDFTELTIDVQTIPFNGQLQFDIYAYEMPTLTSSEIESSFITDNTIGAILAALPLRSLKMEFGNELAPSSIEYNVVVNPNSNMQGEINLEYTEIPQKVGDTWTYEGGLYQQNIISNKDLTPTTGWRWNMGTIMNLAGLCARQYIHNHIGVRNKLSGVIIKDKLKSAPLKFDSVYESTEVVGSYVLNYASLDLLTEAMQCELWEVADYDDVNLTFNVINEEWES